MGSAVYQRERRSSRLFMRLRVLVVGKNKLGRRFRKLCETIVVSAHGALVYVPQPLDSDAMLTVTNPATLDEQECRVAFLGDESGKGQRVGIEFLTPAPHFWGVEFAPSDWVPSQSSPDQN